MRTWVALHVHAGHVLVPSCLVVPLRRRLLWGRQRGHDAPLRPGVDCWWQWRHGTLQVPAAGLPTIHVETHADLFCSIKQPLRVHVAALH